MRIAYKAIDEKGATVADVVDAESIPAAVESLRRSGLFVTDVAEATGREKAYRGTQIQNTPESGRMSLSELLLFTRQLSMLLRSGSPIVPALESIARQLKGPQRSVIAQIQSDMEGGKTLTESLKRFPSTFSEVYVAVVGAGEASANLPDMFSRLAALVKYKREIRNRLLSASTYPCLLILLCIGIVVTMVAFVIPRFKDLFGSLNVPLPTTTRMMFGVSALMHNHWFWMLPLLLGGAVASALFCRSARGRRVLSNMQTRLPVIGTLFGRLIQAQMFRVLGLLIESRVGIMETVRLTSRISQNKDYQQLCASMKLELERGNRFSDALLHSSMISPSIAQAVATGEESGNLDQAMLFVADVLDDENTQMINAVTRLVEPMILILMGVIVGAIALSLFLPLFDLASMAG